jgi:hypothetical protein
MEKAAARLWIKIANLKPALQIIRFGIRFLSVFPAALVVTKALTIRKFIYNIGAS